MMRMADILVPIYLVFWTAPFWAPFAFAAYAFWRKQFTLQMFFGFVTIEAVTLGLHVLAPHWRAVVAM